MSPVDRLTRREREIVALLRRGFGDKEIAAQLHCSVYTVRNHIANARRALGAANRAELASRTR